VQPVKSTGAGAALVEVTLVAGTLLGGALEAGAVAEPLLDAVAVLEAEALGEEISSGTGHVAVTMFIESNEPARSGISSVLLTSPFTSGSISPLAMFRMIVFSESPESIPPTSNLTEDLFVTLAAVKVTVSVVPAFDPAMLADT
jgi:hypothetical protein